MAKCSKGRALDVAVALDGAGFGHWTFDEDGDIVLTINGVRLAVWIGESVVSLFKWDTYEGYGRWHECEHPAGVDGLPRTHEGMIALIQGYIAGLS